MLKLRYGDVSSIKFIEPSCDPKNKIDYNSWLGFVKQKPSSLDVARFFTDRNVNIDATFKPTKNIQENSTPLHHAALIKNQLLAVYLIDLGANVNACDLRGTTPLHAAIYNNDAQMAKLLASKGAFVNNECYDGENDYQVSPFGLACQMGHKKVIQTLLPFQNEIDHEGKSGFTPILLATLGQKLAVINLLAKNGANINLVTKEKKYFPLLLAARQDKPKSVKRLCQLSANPNQDSEGSTALLEAIHSKSLEVIKALCKYCKNTDFNKISKSPDIGIVTPLDYAREIGTYEITKLLSKCGANAITY